MHFGQFSNVLFSCACVCVCERVLMRVIHEMVINEVFHAVWLKGISNGIHRVFFAAESEEKWQEVRV